MIARLFFGVAAVLFCTQATWGADIVATTAPSALSEEAKTRFLMEIIVIFGSVALVVFVSRKLKLDDFVGEIVAGILLGASVLGGLFPQAREYLFPNSAAQSELLELVGEFGILFLLFRSGLGVRPDQALSHKRAAAWLGIGGVLIPLVLGFGLTLLFCKMTGYHPPGNHSVYLFALFLANTLAISAMVIAVRILQGLGIERDEMGQVILCGYAINSIVAWMIYGAIFQLAGSTEGQSIWLAPGKMVGVVALTWWCIRTAPRQIDRWLGRISKAKRQGSVYVFLTSLALALGLVTDFLGVTRYYGVFLAGVTMAGSPFVTREVKERLTTFTEYVMTPIFFVLIGMHLNFRTSFNWKSVVFIVMASIVLKYVGALLSAIGGGRPRREWHALGIAFTPGGVDGIIFGGIALSCGLISDDILGGIIVAAIVSSVLPGPLLKRAVRKAVVREQRQNKLKDFVEESLVWLPRCDAPDRAQAMSRSILMRIAGHTGLSREQLQEQFEASRAAYPEVRSRGFDYPEGLAFLHISTPLERERIFFFWSGRDVEWGTEEAPAKVRLVIVLLGKEGIPDLTVRARLSRVMARIGKEKILELDSTSQEAVRLKLLEFVKDVH